MKTKLLLLTFALGFILLMTVGSLPAAPGDLTDTPSPLIRAEPLGCATYDMLVASLQDKIDRSGASDQPVAP